MEKKYYVKEIARIANVSERTIRYYDDIGLLKPSYKLENGYRMYTHEDVLKLQQILLLKQLDFSLKDIFPIMMNEDKHSMKALMKTQQELLEKKIRHLQKLQETMCDVEKMMEDKTVDWEKVASLIQVSNAQETIFEHYKDAYHLSARIQLHEAYSMNPQGWFPWIYEHLTLDQCSHIIEVGCGDGKLWKQYQNELQHADVFLSDLSMGMVEEAKKHGPKEFHYMRVDVNDIPFKDAYFDCVIANHVLFYMKDIQVGLTEIHRVLQEDGVLYCTTYGKNHMKELTELAKAFDSRIQLSQQNLYERFGLENGERILRQFFSSVERIDYVDALEVKDAKPIYDYIMSCHGNQVEIIGNRLHAFKTFIEEQMKDNTTFHITKEAGMFICRK